MEMLALFVILFHFYTVRGRSLTGRVCLVTGASRGIGRGIARGLAESGATVYVTARSSQGVVTDSELGGTLETLVAEVIALGGKCIPITCDHKNDDDVKRVLGQIEENEGRLDILVNNAFQVPVPPDGKYDPELLFRNFWEQPGKDR